jgi:hypothetical protein
VDLLEPLKAARRKSLEFKRDISSTEGVLRSLVAFGNTAEGTVLVGVSRLVLTPAAIWHPSKQPTCHVGSTDRNARRLANDKSCLCARHAITTDPSDSMR